MRHTVSPWAARRCRRGGSPLLAPILALGAAPGLALAQGADQCEPSVIYCRNATATHTQECGTVTFTPGLAFDGIRTSAWALAHCTGREDRSLSESICVETSSDIVASITPIRITLRLFSGAVFPGEGGGNLTVGHFAVSFTSDARDQFADGAANDGQMGEHWTRMTPDSATAQASDGLGNPLPPGADPTITIRPDDSILVGGISPTYAVYEVTFTVRDATITGFKIDFIDSNGLDLADADGLPTAGPGRHGNGNLLLFEALFGSIRVPTVTVEPQDGRLCHGRPYTLSVGVDGQGPFDYRWRRNGLEIPDATGSTYQVPAGSSTATYDCAISSPCGDVTTRAASVSQGCRADFNCDGFVDFFDYDDFVAGYQGGDMNADCNGDAFIDFFDYDCFTEAFQAGC